MLRFSLAKHFLAQTSDWLRTQAFAIQMEVIVAR
jgi:hypothetical protein